jgi:uncharacterized protein (DUF433 family)
MSTEYVEQVGGVYRVTRSRVSLESIVHAFNRGYSAETIAQSFPVLTEQVYGSIAYYLGHREEVDRYLDAQEQDYEAKRAAARAASPEFHARLGDARRRLAR